MLRLNPRLPYGARRLAARSRQSPAAVVAASLLLVYCVCVDATVDAARAMAAAAMPMPGGWMLSPMWGEACATRPAGAFAGYVVEWSTMSVAMMLPVIAPRLALGRAVLRPGDALRMVAGYFAAWIAIGIGLYPPSAAVAALLLSTPALARAMPSVAGVAIAAAGAFQCSTWKRRRLEYCRGAACFCGGGRSALRSGVVAGMQCVGACAGFIVVLLAVGPMQPATMALLVVATLAERVAADGARVARASGIALVVLGMFMAGRVMAQACGVGS